jgi:hypothetical protein
VRKRKSPAGCPAGLRELVGFFRRSGSVVQRAQTGRPAVMAVAAVMVGAMEAEGHVRLTGYRETPVGASAGCFRGSFSGRIAAL